MTKSEYGPWIPVNGKRPEWLKDNDRIQWTSNLTPRYSWDGWEVPWEAKRVSDWSSKREIRLQKDHWIYQPVKTLRDEFAGQALAGLISRNRYSTPSDFARDAYRMADAMLAEREQER